VDGRQFFRVDTLGGLVSGVKCIHVGSHGEILARVRPRAEVSDGAHELGTEVIMAGLDLVPRVPSLYVEGDIRPQPHDLSRGRVFRRRGFDAAAVRRMRQHSDTGMMPEHPAEAERRRGGYPSVPMAVAPA
jgi:hypothetical protein